MPRRPRIQLDGVPLHVVQRGYHGEACFFAEEDYHAYLHALALALADAHCRLHAYVLMPNHVHLLLTPKRAEAVPRLIISVARRYGQYVHAHYWHDGPLWDSRYKSSPVDPGSSLLACQRYIELNPVRAALVDDPAHYRWTSYRANALGQENDLLEPHAVYLDLGKTARQRQSAYRAQFRTALDRDALDAIRLALNQNQPLGSARFLTRIARVTGERREARPRGRPRLEAAQGL